MEADAILNICCEICMKKYRVVLLFQPFTIWFLLKPARNKVWNKCQNKVILRAGH